MKLTDLIDKLNYALTRCGNLDVRLECCQDSNPTAVCIVDVPTEGQHVRITDDAECILDLYEDEPDEIYENIVIKEIK